MVLRTRGGKQLFLSDWAGWGDFIVRPETLRHERIGSRGWFAVRAGVVYRFEDSAQTDALFLRLITEAAAKDAPALARTGEILWLLSHLLHRRQARPRAYLWHVTLSGMLEYADGRATLRSLQFALPADPLYPDERVRPDGWERACYEKVGASIAQWNADNGGADPRWRDALSRWFESGVVDWLDDGRPRFIGLDGAMRGGRAFMRKLQDMKARWRPALSPQNLIIDERDGAVFFYGLGLLERETCLDRELSDVLARIRGDGYGEGGADALFRMRRDLSRVLKEADGGGTAASCRVEGMASVAGGALQMRYFHVSAPYCHVLEQKTDFAEEIEKG